MPMAVWYGMVYNTILNTIYCRTPACFADFICQCCHLWVSYMIPKVLWEILVTLIHAIWFDLDGYDSTGISKPWSSNKSKIIWYTRSEFPRWVLWKILRDAPNKALGWRPSRSKGAYNKSGPSLWECSSPQGSTHCKVQGNNYHKPKHMYITRHRWLTLNSGHDLTCRITAKVQGIPIIRAGLRWSQGAFTCAILRAIYVVKTMLSGT
jgi:hypothetical protein